ncbi:MAG TPA: DUF4203 domain-containing protein [Thermoanaerobaculia bacterium]|jgi:hypothetical protein
MDALADQMTYSDPLELAVGAVLLLWGRRLYWLALGGLGFVLGLALAQELLDLDAGVELILAVVAGLAGAVLAVVAQKIAVTVGGFVIGAVLAYHAASPWAADLGWGIWWIALLGAVVGVCFAAFLFEAALIVVSSLVGALLITQGLDLERGHETWVFLVLLAIGVMVQSRSRSRARRAPRDDD